MEQKLVLTKKPERFGTEPVLRVSRESMAIIAELAEATAESKASIADKLIAFAAQFVEVREETIKRVGFREDE